MATAAAGASPTPVSVSSSFHDGVASIRGLLGKTRQVSGTRAGGIGSSSRRRTSKLRFRTFVCLLVKAEETSDDGRNVVLNAPEQALSVQLYDMLALLTKNRALDKVQAAGEGEGLGAWRGLQGQWEPKSRSRFTSTLLGILNGRFKGDAQNDIESWERDIRSFEKQTSFAILDCVKAGILLMG